MKNVRSSRSKKVLIFETHPIQYRSPIYRRLEEIRPSACHVVYASDYSLRGGLDHQFAQEITWDNDLLAGYNYTIIDNNISRAPTKWFELRGSGIAAIYDQMSPDAVLLNSLQFSFDFVAYIEALIRGIPVWLRCETQDFAFQRSLFKSYIRSTYYKILYSGIQLAFPIGILNRKHLLSHGFRSYQLMDAHYACPNPSEHLSLKDKKDRRRKIRRLLHIEDNQFMVSFFGKLIPKKDPGLLYSALKYIEWNYLGSYVFAFIGNGVLKDELQAKAYEAMVNYGVRTIFPGFINQSVILEWYLASDIVVLPSRRFGETWGLVVNEALYAGCSVVITDCVGCSADFKDMERVRVIPESSEEALAKAIQELSSYSRCFEWSEAFMSNYSIDSIATTYARAFDRLE